MRTRVDVLTMNTYRGHEVMTSSMEVTPRRGVPTDGGVTPLRG